jgi:D-alanyl-D-alanine carboxypeptidase
MLSRAHTVLLTTLILAAMTASGDALDDRVRAHMKWQRVPGLSIAVVKHGKVIAARGYGLANVETKSDARAESVYKLGSLSKTFMAGGVMVLVQDEKLGLDDPVRAHLPDVPESWSAITIRHLLSHTSGLARELPGFDPYKVQPDAEVIASAYALPLRFTPGTKWEYSNTGYYVLAEVIRRVSGEPWTAFLEKRVFAPAGMTATRPASLDIIPNRARGYETRGGKLQNAEEWLAVRPSGAFLSTVLDLAKWDAALSTNVPLTKVLRMQMETPAGAAMRYGFGWFVDAVEGHRRVYHDGGVPGFVAELHRFPDDGVTVAVLANIGNRDLSDLVLQAAAMHIRGLIAPPPAAIHDPDPELTARLRAFVAGLAKNGFDAALFTAKAASFVQEDLQRGLGERVREQGRLRSFELIERREEGANRVLRYRAAYPHLTLFAVFTLDAENRITAWSLTD